MRDKSEFVFILGIGLIIIAGIVSGQMSALGQELTYGKVNTGNITPGMAIGSLAGELLFLIILTSLAATSDGAAMIAVALEVGLFLVVGMNSKGNYQKYIDVLTGKGPLKK